MADVVEIQLKIIAQGEAEAQRVIASVKGVTNATKGMSQETQKHESALKNASKEIRSFRREMFVFSFTAATVIGTLVALSKNSDALTSQLEKTGNEFGRFFGKIGDFLAKDPGWAVLTDGLKSVNDWLDKIQNKQGGQRTSILPVVGSMINMASLVGMKTPAADTSQLSLATTKMLEDFAIGRAKAEGDTVQALELQISQQRRLLLLQVKGTDAQAKAVAAFDQMAVAQRAALNLTTLKTIEDIRIKTAQAEGNTTKALDLQIAQQRRLLELQLKGNAAKESILSMYDKEAQAQIAAQRRAELGLKTLEQIGKDFVRSIADGFEQGVADPIFKFLQGEKQSWKDILKGFQTPINRAVADAIGAGFKSALFGGLGKKGFSGIWDDIKAALTGKKPDDPIAVETKNNTKSTADSLRSLQSTMDQVKACICSTATSSYQSLDMLRGIATMKVSGSIDMPGQKGGGWLGALGSIFGAISGIGGLFTGGLGNIGSLLGGLGGMFGGGGAGSIIPGAGGGEGQGTSGIFSTLGVLGLGKRTGGFIPSYPKRFASGGEVPAFVTPGEFVVRKSVAQENRDLLLDLNSGKGKRAEGTSNVFFIRANDAQSFAQMLSSPESRAQIAFQISREVMNSGQVRSVIKDFAR